MKLLNVFSIIKYGAKIFLAVMGFISFDDINVKPVGNNSDLISANYVESIPFAEQVQSGDIFYADPAYFFTEEKKPDILFAAHNEDFLMKNNCELFNKLKKDITIQNKIIMLENENFDDFEFEILKDGNKNEFEYSIQVIEDLNAIQKVAVSLKTIHISNTYLAQ